MEWTKIKTPIKLQIELINKELAGIGTGQSAWFCKNCEIISFIQISFIQTEGRMERKEYCEMCGIQTWHKRLDILKKELEKQLETSN